MDIHIYMSYYSIGIYSYRNSIKIQIGGKNCLKNIGILPKFKLIIQNRWKIKLNRLILDQMDSNINQISRD